MSTLTFTVASPIIASVIAGIILGWTTGAFRRGGRVSSPGHLSHSGAAARANSVQDE